VFSFRARTSSRSNSGERFAFSDCRKKRPLEEKNVLEELKTHSSLGRITPDKSLSAKKKGPCGSTTLTWIKRNLGST
jgi:hypothetical protein